MENLITEEKQLYLMITPALVGCKYVLTLILLHVSCCQEITTCLLYQLLVLPKNPSKEPVDEAKLIEAADCC